LVNFIVMYLQTFVETHKPLNLGAVPWQPTLNELNNKIGTPMSTLWFKRMNKIKVEKLLHHGIHSGIKVVFV
jgi:hypothetical protein